MIQKRKELLLLICFFASGFSAMSYEICWIRKASLIFGTSVAASSVVIALFFTGLSAGSIIFGFYTKKLLRPIRTYALLQIIIAIIALFNPFLFSMCESIYKKMYPVFFETPVFLFALRFLLIAILVLPCSFCMGGSFPIFVKLFSYKPRDVGITVGFLYAINTLGGAIGCCMSGFFFFPYIGVNSSIILAAVINAFIALLAAICSIKENPSVSFHQFKSIEDSSSNSVTLSTKNRIIMPLLFFICGFIGMGTQIEWMRFLSLVIHNTVYTYTVTIMVILLGIVIGSTFISYIEKKNKSYALIFGYAQLLFALSVFAVMMLPVSLWNNVLASKSLGVQMILVASFFLFPSILSGVSFPLAIKMIIENPSLAGQKAGLMSGLHTAGGIVGTIAVGLYLLPFFGLYRCLLLTTISTIVVAGIALFILDKTIKSTSKIVFFCIILFCILSIPAITGTKLPASFLATEKSLIEYSEGLGANLAIIRRHNNLKVLEINRLWQGESQKNHQIMAAHIPMILHQSPQKVAVIGIGTGQTASRFLMYPELNSLDCIDIEPTLIPLIKRHFDCNWMHDSRVNIIIEDGRNYLVNTNKKYDIISIEIGQVFLPYLASFYTVDFYRGICPRLNANGIVCQFVSLEFFNYTQFLSVVKSFIEVFPNSVLWYNHSELLLIGSTSKQPFISSNRIKLLENNPLIRDDLRYSYWGGSSFNLNNVGVFLGSFLCGSETLKRISDAYQSYRDDLPLLEFSAAKALYTSSEEVEKSVLLVLQESDSVTSIAEQFFLDSLITETAMRVQRLNLCNILAIQYLRRYLAKGDLKLLHKAIELNPLNAKLHYRMGVSLSEIGRFNDAIPWFEKAVELEPDNIQFLNNIGSFYEANLRDDKASQYYVKALTIDSTYAIAFNNLGRLHARHGNFQKAINCFSAALRSDPNFTEAKKNLELAQKQLSDDIKLPRR